MTKYLQSVMFSLILLGLLPARGLAQGVELRNDPNHPLQIESALVDVQEGGRLIAGARVAVRNKGQVPCIAFAVSLIVKLDNGKSGRLTIAQDRATLGAEELREGIPPGQLLDAATRSRFPIPSGTKLAGVETRLDYIEMAGGATFGRDPDNYKERFGVVRMARDHERKRLLKIYREKGLPALLEELGRP